ncbi:MAG TPA: efflux RND transporter periplasmic adaptor subunit [Phycisphaerae bacterium]|nr:efflux RND transporter periplasmic adaptor subunit [Phycisphaerae bacterium]
MNTAQSVAAPDAPATPPGRAAQQHPPRPRPDSPASHDDAAPPPAPPPAPHDEHEALPKNLRKPHPLTVIFVVLVFIGLLAGLAALGWFPHEKAEKQAQADATEAAGQTLTVAVATPTRAQVTRDIKLPATIRPNQDTLIVPRTTGYLSKLYVDIQDHVKEGQLLAEISTPEVDAELLQARAAQVQADANVTKAQADLDLAQRNLERLQNVHTEVTKQELDTSTTARDQAAAAVDQAKANVTAAQANVKRLEVLQGFEKITAPFDGVITARNFDIGALLTAGQAHELFRIQQYRTLRVFVNVPQVYATSIKTGQDAFLTVRNFPGETFKGTVARTASAVDAATRTMPFELHFDNPDERLLPGMYAEARLPLSNPPQALLVPVGAMLFNATGTQVAVVKDNKVHFQDVTIGNDLGTAIEVLQGLSLQDQVITNPGERLAEGVEVNPSVTQSPAAPAK